MNSRRIHFIACATALLALSSTSLLAQWNTRPLVAVPPVVNTPASGTVGPVTTFQAGAQPFVQPGTQFGQPGAATLPPTVIAPPVITAQPGTQFVQPGTQFVQPGTQFVQPGAPVVMGPANIPNMPAPPPGGFGGAGYDPYYQPLPGAVPPAASLGAPLIPGGTNWNTFGSTAGITPRAGGGTQLGEDVGLNDDLSWFHGFIPIFQNPGQSIWFIETRGIKYHQNSSAFGYNLEGGYRWFSPATNRVNGIYGGYDYRNTGAFHFDQIAFGAESLGPVWDFRANGYLLLSNETQFVNFTNLAYTGNNLVGTANYIDAFNGFDAEAGRNFAAPGTGFDLRVFGGGYGFTSKDSKDAWGVRGRIEATWWNQFSIGASVQHDKVFDTTAYLTFSALFGGANRANPCACPTVADRLGDPLHKNMHIVINQRAEANTVVLNPADNMALQILHIDSNAAAGGTGTFEAPLDALTNAAADIDIVLLHAGSVFVDESITMDNVGQRLLGDSATVPHTTPSQFGTIPLPRANALAAKPIIFGPLNNNGSAVLVSANDVEVSGLNIQLPDDHGIAVNSVTGFNINRNMITGADANNGATGDGIFVNIAGLANVDGTISENMVSGGNNSGIRIVGAGGSFAGTVSNNTSNGNADYGFEFLEISGGTVSGNSASGNGLNGFFAATISGGTISGNTANGNTTHGFGVTTFSGGTFTANTATGNTGRGIFFTTVSGGDVSNNNANGNTLDGFRFTTVSSGTVSNNVAVGNTVDGFFFSSITGGLVDSNQALANTGDGFDLNNSFTGGTFSNNVSNNNGGDGFNNTAGGGTAINNTATGNTGSNVNFPP